MAGPSMSVGDRTAKWRSEHPKEWIGLVTPTPAQVRGMMSRVRKMTVRNAERARMSKRVAFFHARGLTTQGIADRLGITYEWARRYQKSVGLKSNSPKQKWISNFLKGGSR